MTKVPASREHQRVAVGRGVRHLLRADDVRAAALVLDDDLLAPFLGEPLRRPRAP